MVKLFVSDLHLEESRPEITAIFTEFLQKAVRIADSLYILGDFFEAYIGDDDDAVWLLHLKKALRSATRHGLPIFIVHGNRDFLIGRKFLRETGCRLLGDETVIKIAGVRTLLMHGDTLCTDDVAYLKFRRKARNWFFQQLILWKSLAKRREIAESMRQQSREHTQLKSADIMDVTQKEVERIMRKHHVQHLIHGHTHRPAVHTFTLNHKPSTRTVLGAWHDDGNVLICDNQGNQTVQTLLVAEKSLN